MQRFPPLQTKIVTYRIASADISSTENSALLGAVFGTVSAILTTSTHFIKIPHNSLTFTLNMI